MRWALFMSLLFGAAPAIAADPLVWTAYVQHAAQCRSTGDFAKAEKMYALALEEADHSREREMLAARTLELASDCQLEQGDADDAEKNVREALALLEKKVGRDSPELIGALSRLSKACLEQQELDDAEAAMQRVISILASDPHGQIAAKIRCANNLAWIRLAQKRTDDAEKLVRSALDETEQVEDDFDVMAAECLDTLAHVFLAAKQYDQAEACGRQAIAIAHAKYGQSHVKVGQYIDTLGEIYVGTGQLAEAEHHFHAAIEAMKPAVHPNHPEMQKTLGKLRTLIARNHDDASEQSSPESGKPAGKSKAK